jgi:hypothetical protein
MLFGILSKINVFFFAVNKNRNSAQKSGLKDSQNSQKNKLPSDEENITSGNVADQERHFLENLFSSIAPYFQKLVEAQTHQQFQSLISSFDIDPQLKGIFTDQEVSHFLFDVKEFAVKKSDLSDAEKQKELKNFIQSRRPVLKKLIIKILLFRKSKIKKAESEQQIEQQKGSLKMTLEQMEVFSEQDIAEILDNF